MTAEIHDLPGEILLLIFRRYIRSVRLIYGSCNRVCKRWNIIIRDSAEIFEAAMRYELTNDCVSDFLKNRGSLLNLKQLFSTDELFSKNGIRIHKEATLRIPDEYTPLLDEHSMKSAVGHLPSLQAALLKESCGWESYRESASCYSEIRSSVISDSRCNFYLINLSKAIPDSQSLMSLRIPICLGNASTVAIFDKNLICLGEKSFPTVEKCVIIGMYVPQTRYIGITTVNDGSLPKCDAMEKSSFALSMRLLVPSVAMQYSKETKIIGFTGFGFCSQLR